MKKNERVRDRDERDAWGHRRAGVGTFNVDRRGRETQPEAMAHA